MNEASKSIWCALAFGVMTFFARGDVLTGVNGERFVGTVVAETSTNVVFDSELGGRLTFPQSKIRELVRTPPVEITNTLIASLVATNAPTNAVAWMPPGVRF